LILGVITCYTTELGVLLIGYPTKKILPDSLILLVEAIDMVKYGPIWIERFAIHDPEKSGYSVFQMIETSHIACHFCENSGDAYVDIFSCKPFDTTKAEAVIAEYFEPATFSNRMIYRDAGKFI
jgi:S-adenosylmethionine/arginine decarboxylase-like enzyme